MFANLKIWFEKSVMLSAFGGLFQHLTPLKRFLQLLCSFLLIGISYPQDGQLDPSFGQNGIVTTVFDNSTYGSVMRAMAVQDDGKIVAAGYSYNGNRIDDDFIIARYNPNGSFDNTFGLNGVVVAAFNSSREDVATSVAVQNDGKIVAAGYVSVGTDNNDFALLRLKPDGSFDSTFDSDGKVITPVKTTTSPNSTALINAIAIQDDGKIVAGGWSDFGTSSVRDIIFARYNINGTLDNTFGDGDGLKVHGRSGENVIQSMKILDDGKIIAAGYSYEGTATSYDFAVMRLAEDGSNLEFKVFPISTDGLRDLAWSLGMQSDGKYIIGGQSRTGSDYDLALIRLDTSLVLDPSFGINGVKVAAVGSENDNIYSVGIQNDDKIVAAGIYRDGGEANSVVARFQPDGELNLSFSEDGIMLDPTGTSDDLFFSVAADDDGKITAGGHSFDGAVNNFTIARYNEDGSPDNTFGNNGKVTALESISDSYAKSVAIQGDGKIIAAGEFRNYSNSDVEYDFALVRYNPDGSIDNSFGNDGRDTTNFKRADGIQSIAIQPDGRIVAGGSADTEGKFALARYNSDGGLDNSFDGDGKVTTNFGNNDDEINSIVLQSDGKIIAGGYIESMTGMAFALARYNSDGSLDNSFGISGRLITSVGSGNDEMTSLIIQNDGKIIACGTSFNGNDYDLVLVRYQENGIIDNSFGNGGIVITPVEMDLRVWQAALQSDGKIVVGGNAHNGSDYDFCAVRYNTNGSLDSTFGNNGISFIPVGESADDYARSIAVREDGKIVLAGYTDDGSKSPVCSSSIKCRRKSG